MGGALAELRELSASTAASHSAILIIAIGGLVETLWLASHRRAPQRSVLARETAAAAILGAGGLVVGVLLAGVFVLAYDAIARLAPDAAADFWGRQPLVGFFAAFVAWDLVGHLYHRIGHRTAVGWAAHRPHHTGDEFTLSLAWRQSWMPVHACVLPLVALGGWSLSTIVVCAAVSNVLQALQHSSVGFEFPRWLVATMMTPRQHRRHHLGAESSVASGLATAVNFGPILTIWDRMAGSYDPTPVSSDADYGVGAGNNPLRLQFDGWVDLAAHYGRRPGRRE